MYCTLQEAYNIPAFDPASGKKKKGCMMPLRQQATGPPNGSAATAGVDPRLASQMSQQMAQQCANPGLNDTDAYNQYPSSMGREYAADANSGMGSGMGAGGGGGPVMEKFESNRDMPGGYFDTTTPYGAQGNDYKYYCDTYKVCPKPVISVDKFTSGPPSHAQIQGAPPAQPAPATRPPAQCNAPLQAPMYEIPISDAAKKAYATAMNVAMTEEQHMPPPVTPMARKYDMSKVSGYYDEDLEQYLKSNDTLTPIARPAAIAKPAAADNPATVAKAYVPEKSPFANALTEFSAQQLGSPYPENRQNTDGSRGGPFTPSGGNRNMAHLKTIDYVLDITLFVLIGILIILLCDQIFKVAMVHGMKETMRIINPYLQAVENQGLLHR